LLVCSGDLQLQSLIDSGWPSHSGGRVFTCLRVLRGKSIFLLRLALLS
jgi:hypothetical protein